MHPDEKMDGKLVKIEKIGENLLKNFDDFSKNSKKIRILEIPAEIFDPGILMIFLRKILEEAKKIQEIKIGKIHANSLPVLIFFLSQKNLTEIFFIFNRMLLKAEIFVAFQFFQCVSMRKFRIYVKEFPEFLLENLAKICGKNLQILEIFCDQTDFQEYWINFLPEFTNLQSLAIRCSNRQIPLTIFKVAIPEIELPDLFFDFYFRK